VQVLQDFCATCANNEDCSPHSGFLGPRDSHRASPLLRSSNFLHRNDHQLAPICFSLLSPPSKRAYIMIRPILRIDGASQPHTFPTYHTISTVISIYQTIGVLVEVYISFVHPGRAREAKYAPWSHTGLGSG